MPLRRFSTPFIFAAIALALAPVAAAQTKDPVPGVDVSLGQVPGGITLTGKTGPDGSVTLMAPPGMTFELSADTSQVAGATVATISAPGLPTLVSAPLEPLPASKGAARGKTSSRGFGSANGGGALTLIVPAKPAASGRSPPGAGQQQSTYVPVSVTITLAPAPTSPTTTSPATRLPQATGGAATRQSVPATGGKPPG